MKMNYEEWSNDLVDDSIIKEMKRNPLANDAFYSVLIDYIGDPDGFLYDEWVAIHALRWLHDANDARVVPIAAEIVRTMGDDWEMIIVDTAQCVLDRFATPPNLKIYQKIYDERSVKKFSEDFERDLIRKLFSAHDQNPEIEEKMIGFLNSDDADMIAGDLAETKDVKWLSLLELKLEEIAPIIKYCSFNSPFEQFQLRWRELSSAWFDLLNLKKGNVEFQTPPFDFQYYENKSENVTSVGRNERVSLYEREARERDLAVKARFLDRLPRSYFEYQKSGIKNSLVVRQIDSLLEELSFGNANVRALRIGRNDPCPCESGKKYKRCCGLNN